MSRMAPRGTTGTAPTMRHLQILRTVTAAVSRSLNLNEVLQKSVNALTPRWSRRLAGFDVYIWDQCYSMEQSLRID